MLSIIAWQTSPLERPSRNDNYATLCAIVEHEFLDLCK